MASAKGDRDRAVELSDQALALGEEFEDKDSIAYSHYSLGKIALSQGHYEQATRHYDDALILFRELGEDGEMADVLSGLGHATLAQGDAEQAAKRHEEALALGREREGKFTIADALFGLGRVALRRGTQDRWLVAYSLDAMAAVAVAQSQARRATEKLYELIQWTLSPFERDMPSAL